MTEIRLTAAQSTEAGWENQHSDHDHDGIQAKIDAGKRLTKVQKDEAVIMTACWICVPKLNRTRPGRVGTPRVGIVMNVTKGQAAKEKADVIVKALRDSDPLFTSRVTTRKLDGHTLFVATTSTGVVIRAEWDDAARFVFAGSTFAGRRVLNVSAILREIANPDSWE